MTFAERWDIPARLWLTALHLIAWDSGERIGALMAIRWKWISADGSLDIPAEVRKGGDADMSYQLHGETMAVLDSIRQPERGLVFPWDRSPQVLWLRYKKLLKRAGLPFDRWDMFHKLRRSVASHLQAGFRWGFFMQAG